MGWEVVLEREERRTAGVDAVERGRTRERNEHLPRREHVVALDLDRRRRKCLCDRSAVHVGRSGRTSRLHVRDEARRDKDGRVEHHAGERKRAPRGKETCPVAEQDDRSPQRTGDTLDLSGQRGQRAAGRTWWSLRPM